MVDDLPADVAAAATRDEPPAEAAPDLGALVAVLMPLGDRIRATLSDIALIPVHRASPQQRAELWSLRDELDRSRRDLSTWVDAIDLSFRDAAVQLGNAKEIPMQGGVVRVEPPRGEYKVDVEGMRRELLELVPHGVVTRDEVDEAITTVVEYKANNTKLNTLARNRGADVAAVVEAHRHFIPGNPKSAKLRAVRNG